ncbi:endonuclease [Pseudomonas phage PspYZU05]|uniref:Endonuclease II n=1 Tax=Pseudomonas phage PspYZU05 TaxID=1983556 RepID=A0A2U7N2F9_9CAUD|nr:endonuclease [Pseudomonas phage PspYZU05]ASD51965.1 endonuclease II [Pseudomonas phage PspYZU05]
MLDISTVAKEYSFIEYATLTMEQGEIQLIDVPTKHNVLYAISIDGILKYIGKTNNLRTRINYYRTSINRKTPTTDTKKSKLIHSALENNCQVCFYVRQCFELEVNGSMVNTMDLEEPILINKYKPEWNKHHRPKKRQ